MRFTTIEITPCFIVEMKKMMRVILLLQIYYFSFLASRARWIRSSGQK